mmetsp:Transcript_33803/g.74928  ORF Transcript_33803/g.74928 Transcript_33803/m.74928 type:complete len:288 (-) Transcript_33803:585-1448(-)
MPLMAAWSPDPDPGPRRGPFAATTPAAAAFDFERGLSGQGPPGPPAVAAAAAVAAVWRDSGEMVLRSDLACLRLSVTSGSGAAPGSSSTLWPPLARARGDRGALCACAACFCLAPRGGTCCSLAGSPGWSMPPAAAALSALICATAASSSETMDSAVSKVAGSVLDAPRRGSPRAVMSPSSIPSCSRTSSLAARTTLRGTALGLNPKLGMDLDTGRCTTGRAGSVPLYCDRLPSSEVVPGSEARDKLDAVRTVPLVLPLVLPCGLPFVLPCGLLSLGSGMELLRMST